MAPKFTPPSRPRVFRNLWDDLAAKTGLTYLTLFPEVREQMVEAAANDVIRAFNSAKIAGLNFDQFAGACFDALARGQDANSQLPLPPSSDLYPPAAVSTPPDTSKSLSTDS